MNGEQAVLCGGGWGRGGGAALGRHPQSPQPGLSHTMYLLSSLKKSTPPQNCQLHIFIMNDKQ